jgi:hypothetical protein
MKRPAVSAALVLVLAACGTEAPLDPAPPASPGPEFAKPAPSTTRPAAVTILGGDLVADGQGTYQDGLCGVYAKWTSGTDGTSFNFVPAGTSTTCGGTARKVTLVLHTRHLADAPHVDDANAPAGSGTFVMDQFATAVGGGTKINAPPACFLVDRRGKVSGRGLRFDADNYAGSDDLIREDQGNGAWRIYSPPEALAWCEDNSGISFWHVTVDLQVQVQ